MQVLGYSNGDATLVVNRSKDGESIRVIISIILGYHDNESNAKGGDKDSGHETQLGCTSSNLKVEPQLWKRGGTKIVVMKHKLGALQAT